MLILDSITGKPLKNKVTVDNEFYLDISVPVTGFDGFIKKYNETVMVTSELRMRPDIISRLKLGEQNKMDYLLKYNSIDNPFSIDAGDVLAIPLVDDCRKLKNNDQGQDEESTSKSTPSRISKQDQKRLDYVKKMAKQDPNGTAEVASPNVAPKGSKEIKDINGIVSFGTDVTANNPAACEPKSKAELKAKLLQKNIFKKPGN